MKLTAIILLAFCLQVGAKGFTQTVTLSVKNAPLENVFEMIEKQTGYVFFYKAEFLEKSKPVSIEVRNVPLKETLDIIFKELPITYNIDGNIIAIIEKKRKTSVIGINLEINSSPPIDVTGKVVNEKGEPVLGVTVTIKGTSIITYTNENGEFHLTSIDKNATLVFSSVNMETFELVVGGKTDLMVKLKTKIIALDDITVVFNTGYQELQKGRATGSFVKLNSDLISRSTSSFLLDRITSVTSSLNYQPVVTQGSNLTIRGISTISANKSPLVVVDNFPYEGNLNDINPNDISDVTILRDAAAASIWGARSGNGVIVITTKRGRMNQRLRVQSNNNVSLIMKPDLTYIRTIPSKEEIEFEQKLFADSLFNFYDDVYPSFNYYPALSPLIEILLKQRKGSISSAIANDMIEQYKYNDIKSNIKKYLLRTGNNYQNSVNISGGADKISYYGSFGHDKIRDVNIGNDYTRYTLSLANTFQLAKNLEFNGSINYLQVENALIGIDFNAFLPNGLNKMAPYILLKDQYGNANSIPRYLRSAYTDTAQYPGLLDWHYKPLDELKLNDNNAKTSNIRVSTGVKYAIIPSLTVDANFQIQQIYDNYQNLYSKQSFFTRDLINSYVQDPINGAAEYPIPVGNILNRSYTNLKSWNFRTQVNFNKKWMRHELFTIAGIESRQTRITGGSTQYYGYDDQTGTFSANLDYTEVYPLRASLNSATIPINAVYTPTTIQRYLSYYANAAYTYKSKYVLTASARLDGSNFFGIKANQRTVPLWSTGFSWDISKEEFYKVPLLPSLKFRGTYGFNGNLYNGVGAFTTISYQNPSPSSLIPIPYASIVSPPNPHLRWERVKIVNIGIDFSSSRNIINGSIEFYYKSGIDLIGPIKVDATSGVTNYVGNRAKLKGNGMDLMLNVNCINNKMFEWISEMNFSFNQDKVKQYELTNLTAQGKLNGQPVIDRPLYSVFSYRWAGLDPTNGDPRGYVADTVASYAIVVSGSNTKSDDLIYNGPVMPRFFGSLRNTFSWCGLSLSFNITYKLGYFFRRNSINYANLFNNWSGHADYLERWQKASDENITNVPSVPKQIDQARDEFYALTQILVEKGDHIRFQDLRLSYDYFIKSKQHVIKPKLQIYTYITNLGLIWRANRQGIDPDYGSNMIPPSKAITLGLIINL